MELSSSYNPVDPDFYGIIEDLKQWNKEIKIFFFEDDLELNSYTGRIDSVACDQQVEHLRLSTGDSIRLDRIITLNGRPGPLFDYYESFGNACLDCNFEA